MESLLVPDIALVPTLSVSLNSSDDGDKRILPLNWNISKLLTSIVFEDCNCDIWAESLKLRYTLSPFLTTPEDPASAES